MTPTEELLERVLGPIVERAVARVMKAQPKTVEVKRGGELTAKAIATDLGVSVSTLWRWRRAGTFIEPRTTGAGVRWDPVEFDEWKRARTKRRLT